MVESTKGSEIDGSIISNDMANVPDTRGALQDRPPQRELGYRRLAAFMDSDEDFMLFRRFGTLSMRSLLYLQDEIVGLEERLKRLDLRHPTELDEDENRISDPEWEKMRIMKELRVLLREYVDQLEAFARLRKDYPKATRSQQESLVNWLKRMAPVQDEERNGLPKMDDLIAIATKEKTDFERSSLLRDLSRKLNRPRKKLKITPELASLELDFNPLAEESIDKTVKWLTVFLGLVALIVPMLVLQLVLDDRSSAVKAGVTTAFIVVFTLFMTVFTLSKPQELLGATAAYAAVLVVFMANPPSFNFADLPTSPNPSPTST